MNNIDIITKVNDIDIICPNNLINIVAYPLGYIVGCSIPVIEFDSKFRKAFLGSGLPITLCCSMNEFRDSLELAKELEPKFDLIIIDLFDMDEPQIAKVISDNTCKTCGYINCDPIKLINIFREFDFHEIPGIHIFHLPNSITFESNSNHIYLEPLKYRVIDAILTLHFWGKAMGEEINYAICTQAALRGGYRDAKVLIKKYIEILQKNEIEGAIIESQSYNEMTHKEFMEKSEKNFLMSKLNENRGNIAKTAKQLGISRNTLKKKVELYES
jgi:DNA-binding protein Fis